MWKKLSIDWKVVMKTSIDKWDNMQGCAGKQINIYQIKFRVCNHLQVSIGCGAVSRRGWQGVCENS